MKYWIMKSEPAEFSIDDLKRKGVEMWDGIRNYQVRNMLRDDMSVGDKALFYHSSAGPETGVVGVMKIVKGAYPDPTQFKKTSAHYDEKSDKNNPRWLCVDVGYVETLSRLLSLQEIKANKKLADVSMFRKGNRLSVSEITKNQFETMLKMV